LPFLPWKLIKVLECDGESPDNVLNRRNGQKTIKMAIENRNEKPSTI
jgi:hypothetical protein